VRAGVLIKRIFLALVAVWLGFVATPAAADSIFVLQADGTIITLDAEPSDTIENVAQKVEDAIGLSPSLQTFIFAGKRLDFQLTLSDYNIQREATLHLIVGSAPLLAAQQGPGQSGIRSAAALGLAMSDLAEAGAEGLAFSALGYGEGGAFGVSVPVYRDGPWSASLAALSDLDATHAIGGRMAHGGEVINVSLSFSVGRQSAALYDAMAPSRIQFARIDAALPLAWGTADVSPWVAADVTFLSSDAFSSPFGAVSALSQRRIGGEAGLRVAVPFTFAATEMTATAAIGLRADETTTFAHSIATAPVATTFEAESTLGGSLGLSWRTAGGMDMSFDTRHRDGVTVASLTAALRF
jgi:hypothetical protein